MPNTRFNKLDKEKQNLIIRTALEEFSAKNFDQASINQISKKAGLSAGNLYYYFENKEDLYMTVVDYVVNQLKLELSGYSESLTQGAFWDIIKEWLLKRVMISINDKAIGNFFNKLFEYNTSGDINSVEKRVNEKVRSEFRTIFDIGISKGAIRNDLPMDFLFTLHLNLVITTNKWISANWDKFEGVDTNNIEINEFVDKAIELIKSAMQPVA
jgi:AcrR family transcriptional regulator